MTSKILEGGDNTRIGEDDTGVGENDQSMIIAGINCGEGKKVLAENCQQTKVLKCTQCEKVHKSMSSLVRTTITIFNSSEKIMKIKTILYLVIISQSP